jgi:hypothetical protein
MARPTGLLSLNSSDHIAGHSTFIWISTLHNPALELQFPAKKITSNET